MTVQTWITETSTRFHRWSLWVSIMGRKVNKNWHLNLRKSSKFNNDTHPFRLSQCTLPRYQFEKHSGNLFFFILSNTISNSLVYTAIRIVQSEVRWYLVLIDFLVSVRSKNSLNLGSRWNRINRATRNHLNVTKWAIVKIAIFLATSYQANQKSFRKIHHIEKYFHLWLPIL